MTRKYCLWKCERCMGTTPCFCMMEYAYEPKYCADLGANHEEDEACWVKVDPLDVYPTLLSLEYV